MAARTTPVRVLVVGPTGATRSLTDQLARVDRATLDVASAETIADAREDFAGRQPDCVVCVHDPPAVDGTALLRSLRSTHPATPVLIATETPVPDAVLEADPTDVIRLTDGQLEPGVVANRLESIASTRRADELRDSRDTLQRLHEITATPDLTLDEQIDELLAFGAEVFDTDVAFLSQIDADAGELAVVAARGDHPLLEAGDESALGQTYCRRVIDEDTDAPLAIEHAADELSGDPAYERFGLECYFGAEIVVDGEQYGTLCFADERPRESPFSDMDRTLIDIMAQWLSQELTKHEYREALEESRDRYERTLERVDDAFFAVDEDWRVTYANEAGAMALRRAMDTDDDVEDLVGRHLWEEISDAAGTTFHERYRTAMATQESVTFEEYYAPMDAWFEARVYPDEDGLSVYFTDVTDRKQYEQTLNDLLDTTRAFIGASDEAALVDAIIAGLDAVFDYEISSVRLHDPASGTLPPTRVSAGAADRIPDPPTFGDDEGFVGEAFQTGEPTVIEDLSATAADDYGPVDAAMLLPLADHGVLGIGATEPDAFGEEDVALVRLLATAAVGAFDRIERESEMRHLQRIVDHVDEKVFLVDEDGRFTYVTSSLASYLGRDRDALAGVELTEFVAATDVDVCEGALAAVNESGRQESVTLEVSLAVGDGETRPVELELSPTDTAGDTAEFAGVVTDISRLAQTRSHLESERERFEELFDNLPDPVVEVEFVDDDDPVVRYVNPAFVETFGYDPGAARGERLSPLIVPPDESVAVDTLENEGGSTVDVQREAVDGRRDFLLRGFPYTRDESRFAFGVYTDITDQKERERYLQILNRVLRHNLRNDMNVVMSLAGRVADQVDDEDLAGYARTLRDKAAEVATLSDQTKAIERVVGKRGAETQTVNAVRHLRATVDEYRDAYSEVSFTLDAPDALWVEGTEDLRRAVEELVENAVEHDDEAPAVRVEAREAPDRAGWVELRVHDTGPPIPDDEWEIITGETDITQLTHGSGLGLWLTRWVVESVGGELTREERPDGTTVTIRLQRASPSAAERATEESRLR